MKRKIFINSLLVVIFSVEKQYHIFFCIAYPIYLQTFFSFLHLLNVSPLGHVRRRGGKRSVLPVGKYSQYIRAHTSSKKKKKRREYVEKGSRETRIHFFPRRRNSLHHSKQVGRIINMKKN